ncbi:hypothetical protein OAS39_01615 [Pirellulales bacterium]|nr:hypothetical protein [Pirellulales bacterium]
MPTKIDIKTVDDGDLDSSKRGGIGTSTFAKAEVGIGIPVAMSRGQFSAVARLVERRALVCKPMEYYYR